MEFRVSITSVIIFLLVFGTITQGFVSDVNAQMATKGTTSIGFVQIDKSEYNVSYTTSTTVRVNGTVLSPISGDSKITILFKLPDGSTKGSEVAMLSNGYFETSLGLDSNSQKGTYSVMVSYANNVVGSVYFTVEQVAAKSILNKIANQTILKHVANQNDQTSQSNTQHVPASSQSTAQFSSTQSSNTIDVTKPSKIPTWVKKTFVWYGQGQVSEDDLLNAIQYLVQNKLIKITIPQSDTSQNTVPSSTPSNTPQQNQGTTNAQQSKPTTTQQSTSSSASTNNILTNSDFSKIDANVDNYQYAWGKFSGKIMSIDTESGVTAITLDLSEYEFGKEMFVIFNNQDVSQYVKDDCISVEGSIYGKDQGQNAFGSILSYPRLDGKKINKISCLDAFYPALKTINLNLSQKAGNAQVTINKVEFAEKHTRVFVTIQNLNTDREIYFQNQPIVQGQSQYQPTYSAADEKGIDYAILPKIIQKGYIFYDPVPQQSFNLNLEVREQFLSLNDDLDSLDHKITFDIPVQ